MNKDNWKHILVYLELEEDRISDLSLELIEKSLELSQKIEGKVYGILLLKSRSAEIKKIMNLPLEKVFVYQLTEVFQSELDEKPFVDCIEKLHPSIVLLGGTDKGRALSARVATYFRTGVTADCTELDIDEVGNMIQTRPAFGGNIMADIITPEKRPQFATVRKGVFEKVVLEQGRNCEYEIIPFMQNVSQNKINKIDKIIKVSTIEAARVLVVAGRGIKKKEDLFYLQRLATMVNGELACTRALVENGWFDASHQIGLSGKSVAPELLITCGVSGSIQFLAGIKRAKCILAINEDKEANIFKVAHYGMCLDLYLVIHSLIERLEDGCEFKI